MKTTALIGSGGSNSENGSTKLSITADVNRGNRRQKSEDGDDDAFLPGSNSPSPTSERANSNVHTVNTGNQKWNTGLTKEEAPIRTQSFPKDGIARKKHQ